MLKISIFDKLKKFSFKKLKFPSKKTLFHIIVIVYFVIMLSVLALNLTMIIGNAFGDDDVTTVFGVLPVVVEISDMEPELSGGDLAVFKVADNAPKIGDIVCYRHSQEGGEVVIHRVIDVLGTGDNISYITRADNTKLADPLSVSQKDILGIYSFSVPFLGSFITFTRGTAGFIVFVIIPLTAFFIFDFIDRSNISFKELFSRLSTWIITKFSELKNGNKQ